MNPIVDEPIKPAAGWYGVAGGLILAGIVAGIVIFVVAFADTIERFEEINDEIDGFQRVPAPGEGVIELPSPGEYTVYVEGSFTSSDRVAAPEIEIESTEPDSRPLDLSPVAGTSTYDFSGPAVQSVLRFDAPEAGDYRVEVGDPPPLVTGIAIGDDLNILGAVGSVFVAIFVPIGIGGILVLAGVIILVVVAIRRSSAQRRRRQAGLVGAYGTPPATAPPNWPPGPGPSSWPPSSPAP